MKKVLILAIISWLLASCQQDIAFTEFKSLPARGWEADSPVVFTPVLEDSVATYDMQLTLRHTERYGYQNMWLFVDVKQDTLLVRRDTIEAMLANERGEWNGKGISKYTLPLIYLEDIVLQNGNYDVVVQQGMREEVLGGIAEIGLKIIKHE